MASYVYRDEERRERINADMALQDDMDVRYYCPNPDCNAEMYLCQRNGANNPYFRATKKEHGHVKDCPFKNSNNDFDPADYDEDAFRFDDAIGSLLANNAAGQNNQGNAGNHGNGVPQAHPPRTLRQIYFMCKSIPIEENYGGKHICEMILDDRSWTGNGEDFLGNKIIECNAESGYIYFDEFQEMRLSAPFLGKKITIILNVDDNTLYEKIKHEIYNNRTQTIVVAGYWEQVDENTLKTNFINKKQLYIDKN